MLLLLLKMSLLVPLVLLLLMPLLSFKLAKKCAIISSGLVY